MPVDKTESYPHFWMTYPQFSPIWGLFGVMDELWTSHYDAHVVERKTPTGSDRWLPMNTHDLWQGVMARLELTISRANFSTWFRYTFISSYAPGTVAIGVPNTMAQAWLAQHCHKDIVAALEELTGETLRKLTYVVDTKNPGPQSLEREVPQRKAATEDLGFISSDAPQQNAAPTGNIIINPTQTFQTFVVGKHNELAHAAAQAVAAQPGGTYNPLFIYGGVGLGKTHLLHAIANEIHRRWPTTRALYVTCEHFTNDFIHSIRIGKGKEFKDRYRNVDLLLIDDIQFITGKEGTQEEFFHTFNTLHQENKQLVISSDRPPKSIAGLEKRLLSRLEWGMLVDIGQPDLETRMAILAKKCAERNMMLPQDILQLIAASIFSNVRELEGALNKIIAVHQFRDQVPTLETVKPILSSYESEQVKKNVTPKAIITAVSEYFDITGDDVLGKSREKRLAFPRQIIMYLLREEVKSSFPTIGAELGGRDHTTAMHAYNKIKDQLREDEKLRHDMESIKQRMYATS